MVYDIDGNVICNDDGGGGTTHPDAQCTQAFLDYMAKKCTQYGMSGTYYASPSGLTESSYSTPQDLMKLGIATTSYREALAVWATPSQSFPIKGDHARTLSVSNNVISGIGTMMQNAGYKFLGGKGGSLIYSNRHKAQLYLVDIQGVPVILSLMGLGVTSYDSIYQAAVDLADMVNASLNGQTPTESATLQQFVADSGGYAACLVPNVTGGYANLESPAEFLTREHSLSASPTVSRYPASTSKTMTVLCALDYITNIHETITVKTVDIASGSGSTFYDGDQLTMYDALRIMMMESSNTLANTIARTIGDKILTYGV